MARANKWPSKWWFWGPVVGVNLYLLALYLLTRILFWVRGSRPVFVVWRVLAEPCRLFSGFVTIPVTEALGPEVLGKRLTHFAIVVGLWELIALVLGLMCYGLAALVYAIIPGEGGEGKQGDGSP